MKHIIRIGPAWLRCTLLLVAWPASFLRGLWEVPDARMGRYCRLSLGLLWAAWCGEFVPRQ